MTYRSERGFTLIELVLVMLIAGLALSLVAMTTARTHEKTTLEQEARKIMSTLKHAREMSLMQRTPFFFVSDGPGGRFWVERNGEPFGRAHTLREGIAIESVTIVFMPKGSTTGGGVTITGKGGRGYYIAVDPATGRAELARLQPS